MYYTRIEIAHMVTHLITKAGVSPTLTNMINIREPLISLINKTPQENLKQPEDIVDQSTIVKQFGDEDSFKSSKIYLLLLMAELKENANCVGKTPEENKVFGLLEPDLSERILLSRYCGITI